MRRAALATLTLTAALGCAASPPKEQSRSPEPDHGGSQSTRAASTATQRVPARERPSAAAASWFSLRIVETRWCKSTRVPSQRALGVAVELENRTDAWLQVRDRDLELRTESGRKIV